jgi:DNA primase
MLMFGDMVLQRIDANHEKYEITVIEEILHHFEDENYEFQIPTNQKIIENIKIGIENEEIRAGNFFITLMDEDITLKVADALLSPDDLSDWSTRNIFPPAIGDHLADEVEANILIHKYYYIHLLIRKMTADLENHRENNPTAYFDSIKKIMMLTEFSRQLATKLDWSPITKI